MMRKGIRFDKKQSIKTAKWRIIIVFIVVVLTNIVDPIQRRLVEDNTNDEKRFWCILTYSSTVQIFNMIANVFHFCLPFIINLVSTSIIIIDSTRLKSSVQAGQGRKQHLIKQLEEHRHLGVAHLRLFEINANGFR
ncbi:unnamed protein product [Adineta ricciae]|uniref:Uncharacterized protein n=1 Tax=Adineta ricciae TaxID=249248 RepID=A0A816HMW6_ADIRI|nr:unnamed protein product [Adineta ricciae]